MTTTTSTSSTSSTSLKPPTGLHPRHHLGRPLPAPRRGESRHPLPALRPQEGALLPPGGDRQPRPEGRAPARAARVLRPAEEGNQPERSRYQEVAGGGRAAQRDGGQPAEEGDGPGGVE